VRAVAVYTLLGTVKLNDLNPQDCLANIIGRIANYPINRVKELLSWRFNIEA
jgi:hypothetical protein